MFNRSTLQGAVDLMEFLQAAGVRCVIAGGAPRDLFFGVTPKDVDIVVAGSDMETVSKLLSKAGADFIPFHLYHDGLTSDRISGGFKLVGGDIDVVVYDVLNTSEAIEAFDFNLNQFVLSETQRGLDEAVIRFIGEDHWTNLVPVRKDFSEARHGRMQEKWLDLVWRIDASTPNQVDLKGRL